jgi:hypothetical protein
MRVGDSSGPRTKTGLRRWVISEVRHYLAMLAIPEGPHSFSALSSP